MRTAPDLIPTAEVAEIVGVSVATVNRWADRGKLRTAAQAPGPTGARLFARPDVLHLAKTYRQELEARLAKIGGAA